MNGKRARQLRKLMGVQKKSPEYDAKLSKDEHIANRKYKVKKADLETMEAEYEVEETLHTKLSIENKNVSERAYKLLKKDYNDSKTRQIIRNVLEQSTEEK